MASGSGKSLGKIVLTHRSVEAFKPATDAYRVPDLRCPGLAIRVAPSGLKTWDFVCRVRGTSTVKRKALGAFPAVSLDEARRRGGAIGDAAQGGKDLIGEEAKASSLRLRRPSQQLPAMHPLIEEIRARGRKLDLTLTDIDHLTKNRSYFTSSRLKTNPHIEPLLRAIEALDGHIEIVWH